MAKCKYDYPVGARPRSCPLHGLSCPSMGGKAGPEQDTPQVRVTKAQLELAHAWLKANPVAGTKAVSDFVMRHIRNGYELAVHEEPNMVVLVAYLPGESSEVEA